MKSRQLVFPAVGQCIVEEVDMPETAPAGKVLIRNTCSLVSPGTELALYTGIHPGIPIPTNKWAKFPWKAGYCAVGEVVHDSGPFKKGQRVLHAGPHGQYGLIDVDWVQPLIDGTTEVQGAFLKLVQVGMAAPRLAPAKMGERVLVIGLGLIGNFAAQLYNLAGRGVCASERSAARIQKAKACGIDHVFDVSQMPLPDQFAAAKAPAPEIVVEAIGAAPTITESLKVVATKGRVVLLGSPRKPQEIHPYFDVHAKGIHLIGAHAGMVDAAVAKADNILLQEWMISGKIKIDPLITHRVKLEDGPSVYPGLRDHPDQYMGVVFQLA